MVDFEQLLSEGYVVNTEFFTNLEPKEQANFLNYLKSEFFRPGEKVRVCRDKVDMAIDIVRRREGDTRMLESLKSVDDKVFEIEKVYYKHERDISFKLTNSDVLFSAEYFIDSRPTLNMYGVILLIDDRLFAVRLDGNGNEPPRVLEGYEVQGEVELGFGGVFGVNNREEFKHFIQNDADSKNSMCGEFYISDEGMETWCLSAKAWFTSASPQEIDVATSFVETMLSSAPKPN
jgi:hypothetical protein